MLFFTIYLFFFNLTYSRWTSSLPSCLCSLRNSPCLPGSRLTIFFYRDASSAILQLVNQGLNFTFSRSHAFRYGRKNTNPTLGKNRTPDFRTINIRCAGYLLLIDHSGDEPIYIYIYISIHKCTFRPPSPPPPPPRHPAAERNAGGTHAHRPLLWTGSGFGKF